METDGKLKDIEYLATGFMGISRKILNKIKDELKLPICNPNDWARCYPFFECGMWEAHKREKGGEALYISEDWEFCEKVRKVGGRIYADTSVQLGHVREVVYMPFEVARNQQQSYIQKEVYGAVNKQRELMLSVDTDLHEFLNVTLQSAQDNIKRAKTHLFETALFYCQPVFWEDVFQPLVGIKDTKILVMGCGVGSAVFALAEQGNDVVGYDSDRKCIEFCEFKKKKYNLQGNFTTEMPDLSKFNLIVMIDYQDKYPELNISSGSKVYHFEKEQKDLSEWYKQNNLKEWDKRWLIKV